MSDLAQVLAWSANEAELVTGLQAGSDSAFDWLVTHYHGAVYSVVYRLLGNAADAADITQEVFLKAFRGIGGFRRGSSLRTWLYRIAIRQALNQRRWWRRHRREQVSIDAAGEDSPPLELKAEEDGPFDRLAAREVQELVHRALMQVPQAFRSAVILRDLEGLSYEEVSEVLEVSVGTVKSRILRGRRALRDVLGPLLDGQGSVAQSRAHAVGSGRDTQGTREINTARARPALGSRMGLEGLAGGGGE